MHTTALYVIDQQGQERTLLDQDFAPAQLTGILHTLLKTSSGEATSFQDSCVLVRLTGLVQAPTI